MTLEESSKIVEDMYADQTQRNARISFNSLKDETMDAIITCYHSGNTFLQDHAVEVIKNSYFGIAKNKCFGAYQNIPQDRLDELEDDILVAVFNAFFNYKEGTKGTDGRTATFATYLSVCLANAVSEFKREARRRANDSTYSEIENQDLVKEAEEALSQAKREITIENIREHILLTHNIDISYKRVEKVFTAIHRKILPFDTDFESIADKSSSPFDMACEALNIIKLKHYARTLVGDERKMAAVIVASLDCDDLNGRHIVDAFLKANPSYSRKHAKSLYDVVTYKLLWIITTDEHMVATLKCGIPYDPPEYDGLFDDVKDYVKSGGSFVPKPPEPVTDP